MAPPSRLPASSVRDGRADAVYVDGARIQFTHRRCGHTWVEDFAKKPIGRGRMQAGGAQLMARWWSAEKGGCISRCPVCERAAKRAAGKAAGR